GATVWHVVIDVVIGSYQGGSGGRCMLLTTLCPGWQIAYHLDYFALGHFSRFVRPGARRLVTSETATLKDVAFLNADGSIAVVAHNIGAAAAVTVRHGSSSVTARLPANGSATFVLTGGR